MAAERAKALVLSRKSDWLAAERKEAAPRAGIAAPRSARKRKKNRHMTDKCIETPILVAKLKEGEKRTYFRGESDGKWTEFFRERRPESKLLKAFFSRRLKTQSIPARPFLGGRS